jgi:hypothetical protein
VRGRDIVASCNSIPKCAAAAIRYPRGASLARSLKHMTGLDITSGRLTISHPTNISFVISHWHYLGQAALNVIQFHNSCSLEEWTVRVVVAIQFLTWVVSLNIFFLIRLE